MSNNSLHAAPSLKKPKTHDGMIKGNSHTVTRTLYAKTHVSTEFKIIVVTNFNQSALKSVDVIFFKEKKISL